MITHYQRLLDYIVPDRVHIIADGRSRGRAVRSLRSSWKSLGYAEFGDAAGQAA